IAGLMARATVDAKSGFAAVLATPTISGSFFAARVQTNSTLNGFFPVNFPLTWLRLKRVGAVFTGYGSFNGEVWTQVGSTTNPLPNTIRLGVVVSSHTTNSAARVEFRDFTAVTNPIVRAFPAGVEPLGPSSRRTGLTISEIMYHPRSRTDGRNLEFIELFNT